MQQPRYPERLAMMRDLLRTDAANPTGVMFDLGLWAGQSGERHGEFMPETLGMERSVGTCTHEQLDPKHMPTMSCGTVGCALGLAMLSRQFEKFGMGGEYHTTQSGNIMLLPSCNGQSGFEAGEELFGIDHDTSRYLFDPDYYDSTPREAAGELFVAQRIDDLLNGVVDEEWHPEWHTADDNGD
jgi:hypothetical protein